ncbi:hypothetical protein CKAN_02278900 [Cinnamomum micranthum f. kanehirae]|uniref:Uncharacterized protein n=1 Tax=Cinnamomum micranthum f. kanehirae TaxID=337451 RepID=A0A3S4PQG1_9MAGN|nr:hypothetical protein CKAN_02278900 [Cinnamomum micranthum f. kanehirae]
MKKDLHVVSTRFRLLRQHGYKVSIGICSLISLELPPSPPPNRVAKWIHIATDVRMPAGIKVLRVVID